MGGFRLFGNRNLFGSQKIDTSGVNINNLRKEMP